MTPRRTGRAGLAAAVVMLALTACGATATETPTSAPTADPPFGHVHGAGFDPRDGSLWVATHDGLFDVGDDGGATPVGPAIDLMGFAVAGPDRLLASGHPGMGVDLPQPVGLIESTDGGRSWVPVSRQGRSDFHALAVGGAGIVGYDGTLVRSLDGAEWESLQLPAEPAVLAAAPTGSEVLATTAAGLLRSPDGGSSWAPVAGAPLLQTVAWAPDGATVLGAEPSGQVWTSTDAGLAWVRGSAVQGPVQAVAVHSTEDATRLAVVTEQDVLVSDDGGRSFRPLSAALPLR